METNDRSKIIHTPTCTQIHFVFLDIFTSYLREMYVYIYILKEGLSVEDYMSKEKVI